jgi:CheY-like chemotaxis protein
MSRTGAAVNNSRSVSPPLPWRSHRATSASRRSESRKRRPVCPDRPSLLWIDDYKLGLELYRAMFERIGFKVLTASNGAEGIKLATAHQVDVVVTDYEMPGMNGDGVAAAVKQINPEVPVVLFSGSTLVSPRARHLFDACCDKAGSRNQLTATIQRMLLNKRTSDRQPHPEGRASDERHRTVA